MPTVFLNLNEIDARIRAYEERFKISSMEMLKNGEARKRIGEDDVLKWEAYVRQRLYLRDLYEQTQRDYLANLNHESSPKRSKLKKRSADLEYAA